MHADGIGQCNLVRCEQLDGEYAGLARQGNRPGVMMTQLVLVGCGNVNLPGIANLHQVHGGRERCRKLAQGVALALAQSCLQLAGHIGGGCAQIALRKIEHHHFCTLRAGSLARPDTQSLRTTGQRHHSWPLGVLHKKLGIAGATRWLCSRGFSRACLRRLGVIRVGSSTGRRDGQPACQKETRDGRDGAGKGGVRF